MSLGTSAPRVDDPDVLGTEVSVSLTAVSLPGSFPAGAPGRLQGRGKDQIHLTSAPPAITTFFYRSRADNWRRHGKRLCYDDEATTPPRPNLDQLKNQAKGLLKAYKAADVEAYARIREGLPRLSKTSDAKMQDAQHVIASEYSFATWDRLATAVRTPFEAVVKLTDREI